MIDRPEDADPREQRFNEVLGAYLEAADAGWAPDPKALVTSYPDLAPRLEAFFAAQSRIDGLVYPAPAAADKSSPDSEATEDEVERPVASRGRRPQVGDEVGDYRLVELIKEAGQGKVFKARQKAANLVVALKMIKRGRLATEKAVRAFLREAEALANLSHPQIVPIYFVGLHGDLPYFSMKLFARGSLQDHLPRFESDHRAAARLLVTIARAVQYAHDHGLLHRDLKPGNILLDGMDQAVVADFGLAKLLPASGEMTSAAEARTATSEATDEPAGDTPSPTGPGDKTHRDGRGAKTVDRTKTVAPTETQAGAFVGTKGYAPPENAFVTKDSATVRADVFGLGAILYRILTGILLFDAEKLDVMDYAYKVRNEPVPPPRAKNAKVDERLEAVCLKSLKREPSERYATPAEMADDLERWLAGKPPLAWKMPRWQRVLRDASRYVPIVVVAAGLGFALAAVIFTLYYLDPDRVPRALEARAKTGRVTLIGEVGPPEWSRWSLGEGSSIISPEKDQPFSFMTLERGRLELLKHAPAPRFRFSAEVRHDKFILGVSRVGIYFGHVDESTEDEVKHSWCDLTFADQGAGAKVRAGPDPNHKYGEVLFTLRRHGSPAGLDPRPLVEVNPLLEPFLSASEMGLPSGWRKLAIEIRPEKLLVDWEGKPLRKLSQAELLKACKSSYKIGGQLITTEFAYNPSGGLGLYVAQGRASFRNVTVEPLDN